MKMRERQVTILITSALLGVLIVIQARSFTDLTNIVGRDSRTNIFHEIQILKKTNETLEDETKDLQDQLDKAMDQGKALQGIQEEIEKYTILAGHINISGPGLWLEVGKDLKMIWLTDMVNELFAAGAEAVSINGIRLTDTTNGFDTIPNGQILLNGVILKAPFVFEAIGDKKTLEAALTQPEGILVRLTQSLGAVDYKIEQKDLITMQKLL